MGVGWGERISRFLVSGPSAVSNKLQFITITELDLYKKIRILTHMKGPLCNCLSLNL